MLYERYNSYEICQLDSHKMGKIYALPQQLEKDPRFQNIPVIHYKASYNARDSIYSSTIIAQQIEGKKAYEPGSFIDWRYEYNRINKLRKSYFRSSYRRKHVQETFLRWTVLIICSIATALITLFIDYFGSFIHDIRLGICTNAFITLRITCSKEWSDWGSLITKNFILRHFMNCAVAIIGSLILVLIAYKLSSTYANVARSGISEMKMFVSGLVIRGIIGFRMLCSKVIGLFFVIASGLWLGYEGPLVHISCALIGLTMKAFCRLSLEFNNEAIRRELISSGFAIGIASAFNAPIGGVLLGVEQIQSYFAVDKLMWKSFICTMIDVTILQKLRSFRDLSVPDSFKVDLKNNWLYFEAFLYMLLGIVCGGLGVLFNKTNVKVSLIRNRLSRENSKFKTLEICTITITTVILGYMLKVSRYTLNEMLRFLYNDCISGDDNPLCTVNTDYSPWKTLGTLLLLSLEGFLLSAFTYGISIPGGVLLPSLVIGATIGRLLGVFMEFIQYKLSGTASFLHCYNEKSYCISAASYAVVGSASFFAAVTNMSVASIVIVSEMTGALNYIIPIMIGVFCARILNNVTLGKSIYELSLIVKNEVYLPSALEDDMSISSFSMMTVTQLMISLDEAAVLFDDGSFKIEELLQIPTSQSGHPILNSREDKKLIGFISSAQLQHELLKCKEYPTNTVQLSDLSSIEADSMISNISSSVTAIEDLFVVNAGFNLLTTYEAMDKLKLEEIFVCETGTNKFQGIVMKNDLIKLVQSGDKKLRRGFGI